MARHAAGFEGLGASLMAVGCGSVQMAQSFQRELDVQIPLYTDPSRRSYALLGFKRKVLIFGPKIFNRGRRAWSAGWTRLSQSLKRTCSLTGSNPTIERQRGEQYRVSFRRFQSQMPSLAPQEASM